MYVTETGAMGGIKRDKKEGMNIYTFIISTDRLHMNDTYYSIFENLDQIAVHTPQSPIQNKTRSAMHPQHAGCIPHRQHSLHSLSPRANYTDRVTAACRRSDCQLFADRGCHVVPYDRILFF
jgi:hypothetical protein